MTARDLRDVLCDLLGITRAELPPPTPWNEGFEQQMDYAARTYDDETGKSAPLGKRWER